MALKKTVPVEEPAVLPGVYLNPINMEFSVVTSCVENEHGFWATRVWPVGGGEPKEIFLPPRGSQASVNPPSFGGRVNDSLIEKTVLEKFIGDIEDLLPEAERRLKGLSEASAAAKSMLPQE